METMGLGILENITKEEMELAVATIERKRAKEEKKDLINEETKKLFNAIAEIERLGGSVRLIGGGYVPCGKKINECGASKIYVRDY